LTGYPGFGMSVAMPKPPNNKLSLEWVTALDGMALFFDKATWKVFQDAANRREQSAEHMILRAVVACLGTIVEDNMVLNRMLRPSGDCRKIGGQAAIAIGGDGSLAGWNFCPKPEPSVPL
jgi:hypothetical protein